ncbi:lipocalin family protein [Tenacibaculum sp. M341]|uniref:lipocalin family protein n=1 Tax=Tenacibaculum sp. M341 TaxID=2530339 RepID=UPI001051D406|nr:lipocalin family protein [Tenacibaculum sp. M341]TCI84512.1 hypothetical protein EYW44_20935 [Tenacibaculum sp. M341]
MKKISLILFLVLNSLLVSCSSNDNDENITQDLLIGKWKRFKNETICSSGSESSEEYSACQQNGTITFKSDGTFVDEPYIFFNNNCEVDGVYNGSWEVIDGELFTKQNGNASSKKVDYFQISDNSLKIGSKSTPCDNESSDSIKYIEFIRF